MLNIRFIMKCKKINKTNKKKGYAHYLNIDKRNLKALAETG